MELSSFLEKTAAIYSSKMLFKSIYKKYRLGLLAVSHCDLCGLPCQQHLQLCDNCYRDLPIFQQAQVQGDLLNWPAINRQLPKISFDHLICLSAHQYPFDYWLSQFKYSRRFELAELFAYLLANCLGKLLSAGYLQKPEMMLAVPLHCERWQSRGYNQAHLLAKKLQQYLSPQYFIDYQPQLVIRDKKTSPQVGQSGAQRRKNLKSAFNLTNHKSLPAHVLLIDDVVTTGSTASEIATLLKQHGVKKVTLVTVTIALPMKN